MEGQARTIRAEVDERALKLAGEMFEGGVPSVMRELAQNARRAGAQRLDVVWGHGPEKVARTLRLRPSQSLVSLRVRDDGAGCADPALVLRLGGSGWGPERAQESPAGMGLAVLARKQGVRVHSRCADGRGWSMSLDEAAFTGGRSVEVEPLEAAAAERIGPHGFEVSLLSTGWSGVLETASRVAEVMASVPIPWTGNGHEYGTALPLDHWAAGVRVVDGVAYGVMEVSRSEDALDRFAGKRWPWPGGDTNVYGVQIYLGLPELEEAEGEDGRAGRLLRVWAEVRSGSKLALTLPQRDRVVDAEQADEVRREAQRTLVEYAAELEPKFRADGRTLARARALGVALGEAPACLKPWSPEGDSYEARRAVGPGAVLAGQIDVDQAILMGQALDRKEGRLEIFEADRAMQGLSWYDAMPTIEYIGVEEGPHTHWTGEAYCVESLECKVRLDDGREWSAPIGFALRDVLDGALDLTADELHSWECTINASGTPGAETMEAWITSVFEPSQGGDTDPERQIEEFALAVHDCVLDWLGNDGDTRIRHRMADVTCNAMSKDGPPESSRRGAVIHWIPGAGTLAGLAPERKAQELLPAGCPEHADAMRIETALRKAGRRRLGEVAAAEGFDIRVQERGVHLEQAIGEGPGEAVKGRWLGDASIGIGVGAGQEPRAGALAWLAGTRLARWWCRRRLMPQADGIEAMQVLALPVPEALLAKVVAEHEEIAAGRISEWALLGDLYDLDREARDAIWSGATN